MVTKRLPMFPGITDLRLEYADNGYDVYNLMAQCMIQCPLLECLWIIPTPAILFIDPLHGDDVARPPHPPLATTTTHNTNMSFLRLRFDDEVDHARLFSVLSLCPNLSRLSITTYSDPEPFIFELCPRLQYLEWNPRTEDFYLWPPWHKKEMGQGLRYLATTDTALSCLLRHHQHHRIQTLKLVDMSYDYEPETMRFLDSTSCRHVEEIMFDPLESIEIPRQLLPKLTHLSRLTLSILDPDTAEGLVDYFVNHANIIRLETLEINLPIAHSLTKVLEAMACVSTLKHVEICPACVEEETLKTYIMHAPQLEHLCMDHGPILSLETFTLLGQLPHLRILTMASYYNAEPVSGAGIKALVDKKKSNPAFSLAITCKRVEDDNGYIKYAKDQLGERFSFIMLD